MYREWTRESAIKAFHEAVLRCDEENIWLGHNQISAECKLGKMPSAQWYHYTFEEGVLTVRKILKLPLSVTLWRRTRKVHPPKLTRSLDRIKELATNGTLSCTQYDAGRGDDTYSSSSMQRLFGGWKYALEAANVEPVGEKRTIWTYEIGLKKLLSLGQKLGRRPTGDDILHCNQQAARSMPSKSWYMTNYKGLIQAWDAAQVYAVNTWHC